MNITEKLKPCPFCGSENVACLKSYRLRIACIECKESKEHPVYGIQCLICGGVMFGDNKAWNRRQNEI